jgi:hypothetical protein
MSQQFINIGSSPNDSTGDPLRVAFDKINQNFNEVYSNVAGSNFKFQVNTMTTKLGNINISPLGSAVVVGTNNQLYLLGTVDSTSTSSGTLIVKGGVGIAGSLYVGGYFVAPYATFSQLQNTPIGTITPAAGAFTTLSSTDLSVANTIVVSNNISVTNNISSGSLSTGALTATSITSGSGTGTFQSLSSIENIFTNAFINSSTIINLVSSNAQIYGGNISGVSISITALNNTPIGNTTPNTGAFTTMTASNAQITGGNISGVTLSITALNNTPIGNATPNTGVFTSVTTSSGGQHIGYHTGAIGANTANTGAFTTVTTTGDISTSAQFISTKTGSATDATGQILLNGSTSNRIDYVAVGVAAPTNTTRSAGTKIVLYPGVDATGVDYAIGIESGAIWQSVHDSVASFKWYANNNPVAILSGTGNLTVKNQVIGYMNGAIGANTPNSVVATSVTTTNGGQVTGYITGPIGANIANTGVFTTLTATTFIGGFNGTIGSTTPNTGTFTTLTATTLNGGNVTITGNLIAANYTITGNITGSAGTASSATTAGTATYATTAGFATAATTVVQPYQGNITGTGTLANLFVISTATVGNLSTSGNVSAGGNITTGQTFFAGNINVGNAIINGNSLTLANNSNIIIANSFTISNSWGTPGDVTGKIVWSNNYIYVCGANYTGTGPIWFRANLSSF